MLPPTPEVLAARRSEIEASPALSALAERLGRLVAPLLDGALYIPEQKALLSRDGGVCASDGTRLLFDPLNAYEHRCPRCERVHQGERHHRAWLWRYHIWLSERAIHLALLGALTDNAAYVSRAREILGEYAARYRDYPNRDNVLGPTRLFFSTYLESIWLIQLVVAATLVKACDSREANAAADWTDFDGMVEESVGLIASFDEGWSNRQVWNNAAQIAAGIWLGGHRTSHKPRDFLATGLDGEHGIRAQLVSVVADGGQWFEGENYHFFALRGFLLAAELLRGAGIDLYGAGGPADRLRDMYVAPLTTVLPDLTLPARGDSPYGVSLLQPRFAELWEIGWARTGEPALESILSHLYATEAPDRGDPGQNEIAEQEQNRRAQRLTRELLGWKALAWMRPSPPQAPTDLWRRGSTLLPQAGVAVLRPGPERYLSVECGGARGGHGHPDLLHLTLFWQRPLLMDFGTASYVTPSLHWYRSTLAHNAPGVAGVGQTARRAWCAAFDARDGWAWCSSVAENLFGEGTGATRTVVVGPNCVVDVVDVNVGDGVVVDLPIHILGGEYTSLADWRVVDGPVAEHDESLGAVVGLGAHGSVELAVGDKLVFLVSRDGERLLAAERPGPPDDQFADGAPLAFPIRRAAGSGRWVLCFFQQPLLPRAVRAERDRLVVEYRDGSVESLTIGERDCRVVDRDGAKIKLRGHRTRPPQPTERAVCPRLIVCPLLDRRPTPADWETLVPEQAVVRLGKAHYRRAEEAYGARGEFTARAAVCATGTEMCFVVDVTKKDLAFRRGDAPDPAFDNEPPDIHSDGVQCYVGSDRWRGFLLVPDPDSSAVRVLPVAGTAGNESDAVAEWQRSPRGYRMTVAIDVGHSIERGDWIPVNLVINEMYPNRERRAGQLALSGGGGWVYLRGDREHPALALEAEVT